MTIIREERSDDHAIVYDIVQAAFATMQHSSGTEQLIVERLRKSDAFIPELSLVAESDGQITGHILLSKIQVKSNVKEHTILSLAPVSVSPDRQRQGIGSQLITWAHDRALQLGYNAVVLIGHSSYYPRFGYEPAANFDISFPYDSPSENCMAIELKKGALDDVSGEVVYPREFYEEG